MDKTSRQKRYVFLTGIAAAASLVTGCSKASKQWVNAPGTRGFINLDEVKKAFQNNQVVADFEKRINEVFEGDGLVVFSSKETTRGFTLKAKEDLDNDKKFSGKDDLLFTLTVDRSRKRATLEGAGVNKFYKESWVYAPRREQRYSSRHYGHRGPYFGHWYWGRGWGGYYTSRRGYDDMWTSRRTYRGSRNFQDQVRENAKYEGRAAKKYGDGFRKSVGDDVSGPRQHYINKTKKSGGFKTGQSANAGWAVRSNMQKSGSLPKSKHFSAKAARASARSRGGGRSGGRSGGRAGGFRGFSGFGV